MTASQMDATSRSPGPSADGSPLYFSTNPEFHVDLLQMLATVMIGLRDPEEAHKFEKRAFGITLAEELPRWFSGNCEARAFILAFGQKRHFSEDFAVNPLYGRLDLAPLIIEESRARQGQRFDVRFSFKRDGTKLVTVEDLYYGFLESPRSLYLQIRMPLWRITEFQTFVATMMIDPDRRQTISGEAVSQIPALIQVAKEPFGYPNTITLWNYDLPGSDPSRLMTPTHAAWFWRARIVADSVLKGLEPADPRAINAWDVDAHAFEVAIPDIRRAMESGQPIGIVQLPSTLVDQSQLISALVRRGSRSVAGATTDSGDLTIDRHYQTALPRESDAGGAPLYGSAHHANHGRRERYLCARERRIPMVSATNFDELLAAVKNVRPTRAENALLFRGQVRHYRVPRPDHERRLLYGTTEVDELSFLTSASRERFPYDAFHARFQVFMQGLLYQSVPLEVFRRPVSDEKDRLRRPFDDDAVAHTYRQWRTWYGESIWDLVVMGLAQHYGVPTHGLDLTDNLDTAVWFALNEFYTHPDGSRSKAWYRPLDGWEPGSEPVVYVVEVQNGLLRHLGSAMRGLPIPRPKRVARQAAYLHYGGWGLQANACAEDVKLAVCLAPGFGQRQSTSVMHFFPEPPDDPFFESLLRTKAMPLPRGLREGFERIVEYENPDDRVLYEAVMMERLDAARALLKAGAGVRYRDPGDPRHPFPANAGLTTLHWAAFHGEIELAAQLLDAGAELEACDAMGRRPLVCAAMTGKHEVVRLLLQRGASLDAMRYAGWTMLDPRQRSRRVVELLGQRETSQENSAFERAERSLGVDGEQRWKARRELVDEGDAYREQGQHAEAFKCYRAAAQFFRDVIAHAESAGRHFEAAVLSLDLVVPASRAGELYVELDELEEALPFLEETAACFDKAVDHIRESRVDDFQQKVRSARERAVRIGNLVERRRKAREVVDGLRDRHVVAPRAAMLIAKYGAEISEDDQTKRDLLLEESMTRGLTEAFFEVHDMSSAENLERFESFVVEHGVAITVAGLELLSVYRDPGRLLAWR